MKLIHLLVVFIIGATLAIAVMGMPAFGSSTSPGYTHVGSYYLENAQEETGVNNIVTAVVVYYRGYDTFGEVTVIFTAGTAVLALFVMGRD